jgi:hypothetical protein
LSWARRGATVTGLDFSAPAIEFLHEFDHTLWARWPFLEERDDRTFHLPAGVPSLPLMYSLRATKPA